jgi:hypothetical protein
MIRAFALAFALSLPVHAALPARTSAATNEPSTARDPETAAEPASEAAAERTERPSSTRRALALPAAVVPGVVVHGTGHFALGEPRTARRLLLMEGIGLGLFFAGGLTIVFTGASRYFVAPAAATTMTGFGLFSTSYFADIYGTVSTDGGATLSRYRAPARWETELGYRRIEDSQFAYRDFLFQRVSRQIGPFRLNPSGWFDLRGGTARYRLEGQLRLAGNYEDPRPRDASYLDVTAGFVHQRHRPEEFAKSSAELSVDGRYDLARLGPTLRGAFVDLSAGYAISRIDFDVSSVPVPGDIEHVLLGRFGFGVMLRGQSAPGSEAMVYYDHRHDDYAAGLKITGLGSGVVGHFGLSARWFFNDTIGVASDFQVGSAYVAGASLVFRSGLPRPRGLQ